MQPDKCKFFRKEIAYLGHVITKDGINSNSSKTEVIKIFLNQLTENKLYRLNI